MKTKSRLVVTLGLSLACALAACDPGPAGPPTEPSDPTKTGYEPSGEDTSFTTGAGASIDQLCAYDCMRIATTCPSLADTSCTSQCASAAIGLPMCESVFRTFLQCVASAPVSCANGGVDPAACQQQANDVSNCMNGISTGTAGASGGGGGLKF
jgi:hypothetical protein